MARRVLFLLLLGIGILGAGISSRAQEPGYGAPIGIGTAADPATERAFVIYPAISPSGRNLPEGSGTVQEGARIYAEKCARCHGPSGKEGPFDELVGPGQPVYGPKASRNIGNYWPYATTIYDYVKRATPADHPGYLGPSEVYAVTAWLLNQNGILPSDGVLDRETLPKVQMPGRNRFVPDPRPLVP